MIGTHIGKYLVKAIMGEGGMGRVYLALDEQLDREVAIKSLNPQLTAESGFRERFKSEAKAMARLNHPGVVTVHDFIDDGSSYYIVMEKIDGISLHDLINRYPEGLPLPMAVKIYLKTLESVDYAHRQGVIHRDLKPANILVTNGDNVKVLDFGIAKLIGDKQLTGSGGSFGTAHFMSPEQITNPGKVDHRADVYSLGIVLYNMLTSKVPFDGDTDYYIKHAHIEMPPPKARSVRADLPEWVDDCIDKALEKNPDNRYSGCSEFIREIEKFAAQDIAGGAYGGAYGSVHGGGILAESVHSAGIQADSIPSAGIQAGNTTETLVPARIEAFKARIGGRALVTAASIILALLLAVSGVYSYNAINNRNKERAKQALQEKERLLKEAEQRKNTAARMAIEEKQRAEQAQLKGIQTQQDAVQTQLKADLEKQLATQENPKGTTAKTQVKKAARQKPTTLRKSMAQKMPLPHAPGNKAQNETDSLNVYPSDRKSDNVMQHYSNSRSTQHFTGSNFTQHFPGSKSTQHYSNSSSTQHYPGSRSTQHYSDIRGMQHFLDVRVMRSHSNFRVKHR
ncbi:MAG: protein kinase [Nitrospirae bacterium]|nr:protein kinase [Nitrospirota bacterium]